MAKYLSTEKNIVLVLDMLKSFGIKRVIASPGATNRMIVASMQADKSFEMYSSVDERSAAYMAVGMCEESGEPVVLSCTGATASRNYLPALTEAFYRKLPIIVITSSQNEAFQGHLYHQLTDRSHYLGDILVDGVQIQTINSDLDYWDCVNKINRVFNACKRRGGGPVHINLMNNFNSISADNLTSLRTIHRITSSDIAPTLPKGKIGIFISSHKVFTNEETKAIDVFCSQNNSVVFCDNTSNYYGDYRVDYALIGTQKKHHFDLSDLDLLIHIGEMTGDNPTIASLSGKQVWRVNIDGEIRVRFGRLDYIFEMSELDFFKVYNTSSSEKTTSFRDQIEAVYDSLYEQIPDSIPFSNVWVAKTLAPKLPVNSVLHLAILSSLRSWNLFKVSKTIRRYCNVGGFGIDGCTSTVIGASLVNPKQLFFLSSGDLAFFYDLNSLGNRHIGNNLRILLINNGKGGEFKSSTYRQLPVEVDDYCAAGGHYGRQSKDLVKHFSEDLGFEYLVASSKDEFLSKMERFVTPVLTEKPMLFEIFVQTEDQRKALDTIYALAEPDFDEAMSIRKKEANKILHSGLSKLKSLIK